MPGKRKHEGSDEKALEDLTNIGDNSTTAGGTTTKFACTCGPSALPKPVSDCHARLPPFPCTGLGDRMHKMCDRCLSIHYLLTRCGALLQVLICQNRRRSA